MDLKHELISLIALLALDNRRKVQKIEDRYNIKSPVGFVPKSIRDEYNKLLLEFEILKTRAKAIQNGD